MSTSIPYELRIGVTGRRNLPNHQAVEHSVQDTLSYLSDVFSLSVM